MYCPLPRVAEDLDALRAELRQERHAERKRRLHLLVLMASGAVRTRKEAAEHLAVHRITIGRWLNGYQDEGLAGLLRIGTPGAPAEQRTLSPAAYEALQARLAEPSGRCRGADVEHRPSPAQCAVTHLATGPHGATYSLDLCR